jgi:hypothetical protein
MNDAFASKENSYRLRFPRRSSWLARIGNPLGPAKTAGWPGDVRGGILQSKRELPPAAVDAVEFRPRADPQPSFTPHCPTSPSNAQRPGIRQNARRSDKRGCEGRLRSRLSAKLIRILRRRRELHNWAADGRTEREPASQRFSQRQGFSLFEPADLSGTKTVTEKNVFVDHPMALIPGNATS